MAQVQMVDAGVPAGTLVESMRTVGMKSVAIVHGGNAYVVSFADLVTRAISSHTAALGDLVDVNNDVVHNLPGAALAGQTGPGLEVPDSELAKLNFVVAGYKHCGHIPTHIYAADDPRTTCSVDGTTLVEVSG